MKKRKEITGVKPHQIVNPKPTSKNKTKPNPNKDQIWYYQEWPTHTNTHEGKQDTGNNKNNRPKYRLCDPSPPYLRKKGTSYIKEELIRKCSRAFYFSNKKIHTVLVTKYMPWTKKLWTGDFLFECKLICV